MAGKGIATEVCAALMWYAEKEFGFKRVQTLVKPQNEYSVKRLEKLVFVFDREVWLPDESYHVFIHEQ